MIKVPKDTPLTASNLISWIAEWEKDKARLEELWQYFTNKNARGERILKLPFAKKLIITSSSATVGDGVVLSAPDLKGTEKATFEEVLRLLKVQTAHAHDRRLIKQGCIFGRAYELAYMSDDADPVPKVAVYKATNAFVVFDNTVEHNSLYGVCYSRYRKDDADWVRADVYDAIYKYEVNYQASQAGTPDKVCLSDGIEHHMGRVPLTEYYNSEEEQGDFEQVIGLMIDRTDVHNLNLKDMKAIAKNYLKGRNVEFRGVTDEEKRDTTKNMADAQRIEFKTDSMDAADDVGILTKAENYSSVDVYGEDITSKIYDLSMIPDLSAEQFAGNQSGVALELKLMPFKELVSSKDEEIEKLYRRRLKMYIHALSQKGFAPLDVSQINIEIKRDWSKNITELAMLISSLFPTGLFSEEYLINKMPDADYQKEKARKESEAAEREKRKPSDPNNSSAEWLASLLQGDRDGAAGESKVVSVNGGGDEGHS